MPDFFCVEYEQTNYTFPKTEAPVYTYNMKFKLKTNTLMPLESNGFIS